MPPEDQDPPSKSKTYGGMSLEELRKRLRPEGPDEFGGMSPEELRKKLAIGAVELRRILEKTCIPCELNASAEFRH